MANKEIHYLSDGGTMFWPATTTTAIIDPTSQEILSDILNKKVSVGDAGNVASTVLPPVILESISINTLDIIMTSALIGKTYYHPDTKKIRHFYADSRGLNGVSAETTDPSPELIYYNKATDKFYRWDSTNLIMVEIASSGGNGGSSSEGGIQEITWSALKTLRDGGDLTPGQFYRITDYTCTTTQTDTHSAGHVFDIIVFALSESILSEEAWADHHEGDTYFSNCKLEAWELKYCLDNDDTQFDWADTTNGKGVIYYMKDERDNECPYDFKNIQFEKDIDDDGELDESSGNSTYVYTFNYWDSFSNLSKDATLLSSNSSIVIGNTIRPYRQDGTSSNLNIIIAFLNSSNSDFYCNSFDYDCHDITIGSSSYYNNFGKVCSDIKIGKSFRYNNIGNRCRSSEFGNSCTNNVLENNCSSNTVGNSFTNNMLGAACSNNTFGNFNRYFTFGNSCKYITVNSSYVSYLFVEAGNQYITLTTSQTPNSTSQLRNIKIASGVNNTTTVKTISHNTLNDTFQTTYKPANSVEISV